MTIYIITYAWGEPIFVYRQKLFSASVKEHMGDELRVIEGNLSFLPVEVLKKYNHILKQPRGVGFWLWKPLMILQLMKEAKDSDVIIYMDGPSMTMINNLDPLIDLTFTAPRVFFLNFHSNHPFVKRDCYIGLDCDYPQAYEAPQLDASFMLFLNNEDNRAFVGQWLRYCCDEQLLTDIPSKQEELEGFLDHRHDQAILSLLWFKNPTGTHVLPHEDKYKFISHHRNREF